MTHHFAVADLEDHEEVVVASEVGLVVVVVTAVALAMIAVGSEEGIVDHQGNSI